MDKQPLISLIVPNYNSANYIKDFIESVIAQTYQNWELLIIDDNSSDNSLQLAQSYSLIDSRIKVLERLGSKGACARRNQGLDIAQGEFICFFDSDDILPTWSLDYRVKELILNKELDFLVSPAITFKDTPGDLKHLVLGIPIFKDDLSMFLKRYRLPFGVWTNTYRMEFLKKSNIRWDEDLASMQDSDFNIRSLKYGAKYKYSTNPKPCYYWRIGGNPNSITKTIKSIKNIESQIYFYNKLLNLFENTKYFSDLKRFGLTILLRCAILDYNNNLYSLTKNTYTLLRIKILTHLYHIQILQKNYLLLQLMLFPLKMTDEYLFRIKNILTCKKYFKQINNK